VDACGRGPCVIVVAHRGRRLWWGGSRQQQGPTVGGGSGSLSPRRGRQPWWATPLCACPCTTARCRQ